MSESVYLNGDIVPVAEARVSVLDAGFTHAAGLFETLRAYNGKIMRLRDHIRRMLDSAASLEMQIPVTAEELEQAAQTVLSANGLREARMRITVTPGQVPRAGEEELPATPTVLIRAEPMRKYPPELYRQGMRVCICSYKQNRLDPLAGHKTLAYLPRLLAMKEAASRRCNEALWFTTENRLAEGCICNVFVVDEGTILTPPTSTPILPGIVRKVLIELAAEHEIPLEERPIDIETLLTASEVFLTGSVLEIMPVTSIEKHIVGEGRPGPVAGRMSELYRQQVERECPTD